MWIFRRRCGLAIARPSAISVLAGPSEPSPPSGVSSTWPIGQNGAGDVPHCTGAQRLVSIAFIARVFDWVRLRLFIHVIPFSSLGDELVRLPVFFFPDYRGG